MAVPKNTPHTDAATGEQIQLQHVAVKLNHGPPAVFMGGLAAPGTGRRG
jgi:hypothetical protein